MKIYAVKFIDVIGSDDYIVDYFMNKEKAKKLCDNLIQAHKDDGLYLVKEIEVKE